MTELTYIDLSMYSGLQAHSKGLANICIIRLAHGQGLHKMHMVCMHNFYTHFYGLVFAHTGSHIFVWTCVCPTGLCTHSQSFHACWFAHAHTYKFSHTCSRLVSVDSGTVKCMHLHIHTGLHRHMGLSRFTDTHRCMRLIQMQTFTRTYTCILACACRITQ